MARVPLPLLVGMWHGPELYCGYYKIIFWTESSSLFLGLAMSPLKDKHGQKMTEKSYCSIKNVPTSYSYCNNVCLFDIPRSLTDPGLVHAQFVVCRFLFPILHTLLLMLLSVNCGRPWAVMLCNAYYLVESTMRQNPRKLWSCERIVECCKDIQIASAPSWWASAAPVFIRVSLMLCFSIPHK